MADGACDGAARRNNAARRPTGVRRCRCVTLLIVPASSARTWLARVHGQLPHPPPPPPPPPPSPPPPLPRPCRRPAEASSQEAARRQAPPSPFTRMRTRSSLAIWALRASSV